MHTYTYTYTYIYQGARRIGSASWMQAGSLPLSVWFRSLLSLSPPPMLRLPASLLRLPASMPRPLPLPPPPDKT